MSDDPEYGKYIHLITKKTKYLADENLLKHNITLEQVHVMRFLSDNDGRIIYQKDIEKNFDIKRSTVTSILQLMEKKQLIIRKEDEKDARMKMVIFTDKGKNLSMELKNFINHLEDVIVDGISEEDKAKYLLLLKKSLDNLTNYSIKMKV